MKCGLIVSLGILSGYSWRWRCPEFRHRNAAENTANRQSRLRRRVVRCQRGGRRLSGQDATRQRARSNAYFEGGYWLLLWDFLSTVFVMWLLLRFRWSARMRNLAERITRIPPVADGTLLDSIHYRRVRADLPSHHVRRLFP